MIALDLDGTLINHDGTVSSAAKEAVKRLFQRGLTIGIATGRSFDEAKMLLEQNGLGADSGYPQFLICEERDIYRLNQAAYYPAAVRNNVLLDEEREALDCSRRVFQRLEAELQIPFFVNNGVLQRSRGFVELFCASSAETQQCFAFLAEATAGLEIRPIRNKRGITLRHRKVGKRQALEEMAAELAVPAEQVLVMGDSHNDLAMLTAGFRAATTANADEEIKRAVRVRGGHISGLEASDGVADILAKVFAFDKGEIDPN